MWKKNLYCHYCTKYYCKSNSRISHGLKMCTVLKDWALIQEINDTMNFMLIAGIHGKTIFGASSGQGTKNPLALCFY